jgi:DNA-binding Lrp family transcriptional regulator
MIEQPPKEEILHIIKEIEIDPSATQRALSGRLGISLGKTNYFLKELIKKGVIKVKNFSTRPGKLGKINNLKQEWEQLVNDKSRALFRSSNGII